MVTAGPVRGPWMVGRGIPVPCHLGQALEGRLTRETGLVHCSGALLLQGLAVGVCLEAVMPQDISVFLQGVTT